MGLSHLPFSKSSSSNSIPYRKPNYSDEVIAQLRSEISLLEYKHKVLKNPKDFEIVDEAAIEADFYKRLHKLENDLGVKACPDGESNLWKELQFLAINDPEKTSEHWMAFHQINEFRDSQRRPEARSPEEQIAEIETKLTALVQTWFDYTGTLYPR